MEKINRIIQLKPDQNYYLTLFLNNDFDNIGVYTDIDLPEIIGEVEEFTISDPDNFIVNEIPTFNVDQYFITGETKSRLEELRNYSNSENLVDRYFISNTPFVNGVDFDNSVFPQILYYIDNIQFMTDYFSEKTIFAFSIQGLTSETAKITTIIKEEKYGEIVENPRVLADINIDRQSISVFENHYRLGDIKNMFDLENYGGGTVFNIIKNS